MRVLVTNDDGVDSPGLHALARAAVEAGLETVVAAPHSERSGSSASLGAMRSDGRMLMREHALESLPQVRAFAVEATPAFIAWAAARGAFGAPPELVLSGINLGPNTGHAVLHSGTVGAAFTALAHGIPAAAFSVTSTDPQQWATAEEVVSSVLGWLVRQQGLPSVVYNVNVPDVPPEHYRGLRAAPLSSFGAVQADIAEVGEGFVSLTFSEVDVSTEPHTDAGLQTAGWATVTPLVGPSAADHALLDGLVDRQS